MALSVGALLGKKYKVLRQLGRGSRGDVYLAEDMLLDRQVAIKHLRPGSVCEKSDVEKFLSEARIIARIRDENVVAIYDALDEEDGNYYLVIEYADQGTVADLLQREGRLPVLQALELGLVAARALEVVHVEEILHGDIKPSNILLISTRQGDKAKLADFGLSRVMSESGPEQVNYSGSILYASPEQIQGGTLDYRADLYALGAVLYEMLTGCPPFPYSGKDVGEIIQGHLEQLPEPPSQLNPEVSPAVDELILKALSKSPEDRFTDAHEMSQVLEQAIVTHKAWKEQIDIAYQRGVEHERREEWEAAIVCYEDVLQQQPGRVEICERLTKIRENLVWETRYTEGLAAYDKGLWAGALEILAKVVAYDKDYADGDAAAKLKEAQRQSKLATWYEHARAHEENEHWSAAVELYLKLLTSESDYRDVSARLAHAVEQQKRQALYNKAQRHLTAETWGEAIKTLQELRARKPDYRDSEALLIQARRQKRLGELYDEAEEALNAGDWELAIEAFEQVLRLEPEYGDAAVKQAIARQQVQLAELYEQAQAQMGAEVWGAAAATLQEIKDITASYKDVDTLLRKVLEKQRIAEAYQEGMQLYEQEEWEQAIQRLEELQRLDPGYRDVEQRLQEARLAQRLHAHYDQARQFEVEENWAEATSAYSEILRLDPNNRNAKVGLARVSAAALGREQPSQAESQERRIAFVGALLVVFALSFTTFLPRTINHITPTLTPGPTPDCTGETFGKLECWERGGELDQTVEFQDDEQHVVLGNPDYYCKGGVPVGEAWIKHRLYVPQANSPTLLVEYCIFSQDLDLPEYDYFQVFVNGEPFSDRLGNFEWNKPSCEDPPWDSKWQKVELDLSAYKGQDVEIALRNFNGTHKFYNTWTRVRSVRIEARR